ncbi:MAG: hypothetical protein QM767_17990 [Anaeromyxobacter sp.]
MKTLTAILAAAALLAQAAPALACEGQKSHTADKKSTQQTTTAQKQAKPAQAQPAAVSQSAQQQQAPKAATN